MDKAWSNREGIVGIYQNNVFKKNNYALTENFNLWKELTG